MYLPWRRQVLTYDLPFSPLCQLHRAVWNRVFLWWRLWKEPKHIHIGKDKNKNEVNFAHRLWLRIYLFFKFLVSCNFVKVMPHLLFVCVRFLSFCFPLSKVNRNVKSMNCKFVSGIRMLLWMPPLWDCANICYYPDNLFMPVLTPSGSNLFWNSS